MISRRAFVLTSLAGSAGLLSGCGQENTAPAPNSAPAPPRQLRKPPASLDLYFVGGTAFRNTGASYVAVQLRGKGVVHNDHRLDHRSYLVAPAGTFGKEGKPFPPDYDMTKLHPDFALPAPSYEAVCLVGKDVALSQVDGGTAVNYKASEVADYEALAAKYRWQPKGSWTPGENGPVSSRFTFTAGDLVNGKAVNKKGYAAKYKIGGGDAKTLSDVAVLELRAESISIAGIGSTPFTVPGEKPLKLYVFGGPEFRHPARKYRQVSHAVLLKTIYDVKGATDAEIMPSSDTDVDPERPGDPRHPCDFGGSAARAGAQLRVPPDTEYCVNYDKLP
jgi:hypothetical protein